MSRDSALTEKPTGTIFLLTPSGQHSNYGGGESSAPQLPQCDMLFTQETLNRYHPTSAIYRHGTERKQRRFMVEEKEEQIGRVLLEYGTPLTAVYSFRYLGQTLLSTEDDWTVVERNLWRARGNGDGWRISWEWREWTRDWWGGSMWQWCKRCSCLGPRNGYCPPQFEKDLKGFHHQEARQMAGMGPNHKPDRMWVYPPIGVALAILGLEEIGVYISRRHNTVVK